MMKIKTCICMMLLLVTLVFAGLYVYHYNFEKTNLTEDATLV